MSIQGVYDTYRKVHNPPTNTSTYKVKSPPTSSSDVTFEAGLLMTFLIEELDILTSSPNVTQLIRIIT